MTAAPGPGTRVRIRSGNPLAEHLVSPDGVVRGTPKPLLNGFDLCAAFTHIDGQEIEFCLDLDEIEVRR